VCYCKGFLRVAAALAAKSAALDARHAELVARQDKVEVEIGRLALSDDDMERYRQMRADIARVMENATREQMRAILRACGLEIVVKGDSVVVSSRAFFFIPPSEPIPVRKNVRKRKAARRCSPDLPSTHEADTLLNNG